MDFTKKKATKVDIIKSGSDAEAKKIAELEKEMKAAEAL